MDLPKRNFVAIESLRAWMAWWVVVGHAIQLCGVSLPEAYGETIFQKAMNSVQHGNTPVNVFIVVSGFVITHLVTGSETKYGAYIVRRAFRIFPIYLASLLFSILTISFFTAAYFELTYSQYYDLRLDRFHEQEDHFVTHLALHLTLLHGMVPDSLLKYSSATLLTPAWSLSLEWQFYVIAPLILAVLTRSPTQALITIIGTFTLYSFAKLGLFGSWEFPAFLPLSINAFFLGIASRLALNAPRKYLWLCICGVISISPALTSIKSAVIWVAFYGVILYELDYLKLRLKIVELLVRIFVLNSNIANIGKWSYSTYLLHIPLFSIIVGGYVRLFGAENTSRETVIILLCASFPLLLALSWLTYSFIEKPFLWVGQRLALAEGQR
jgi:peptidoglycan/LPS O-acetylase OafA/YrhL